MPKVKRNVCQIKTINIINSEGINTQTFVIVTYILNASVTFFFI